MNLEEDILIENFIKGNLSDSELKSFLARLETDDSFKKKVMFEEQLAASLNDQDWSLMNKKDSQEVNSYKEIYLSDEIQNLKRKIQDVNERYKKPKRKTMPRWLLLAAAASIALFVVLNMQFNTYNSIELYQDYVEMQNLPSFISRDYEKENGLVKAQILFEKKEYSKALLLFTEELDISEKNNSLVYLYIGIAQTELNEFSSAETTFNKLITSGFIDAEKGKWYQALLYLKMNRIDETKVLLNELIAQRLYNYKKADKLIKKIDKIKR